MIQKIEPKISRTRFAGGNKYYAARSLVLTIPQEYAKAFDIKEPTNVLLTATDQGILISKLEIKNDAY
jgi:hypothetical protein